MNNKHNYKSNNSNSNTITNNNRTSNNYNNKNNNNNIINDKNKNNENNLVAKEINFIKFAEHLPPGIFEEFTNINIDNYKNIINNIYNNNNSFI